MNDDLEAMTSLIVEFLAHALNSTDRELREKGMHIAEDWMGYYSSCDLQGMIWREQSRSEEL